MTEFYNNVLRPEPAPSGSPSDVVYLCTICSRSVPNYRNARKHATTHMEVELRDRVDRYVMRKVERDLVTNTFACTVCSKELKSKKDQPMAYERDHCLWHHLLIVDKMRF